jgi:hypothetical protein
VALGINAGEENLIDHIFQYGGNFFFYGTFFSYVVFLVVFTLSHWWRSPMGQHVFFFMLVLAVLFGLGIARRIFGGAWFDEHRLAITFWSFAATFFVGWWRVVILIVARMIKPEQLVLPPEPQEVPDSQRVVVEGENQRVTLEDGGVQVADSP